MDHTRLLNDLRDPELLTTALELTLSDRVENGSYYDFFDLAWADANRERVISELVEELSDPGGYRPRLGQAYYPPKTELVYRRMVYIPIKDTVVRYAFALVLSRYLEPALSETCFANRRATGDRAGQRLLVDFARDSWPNFCAWQKEMAEEHTVLLRTDISAFYDSVSHEYLCQDMARVLCIPNDCALLSLFRRTLTTPVLTYSELTGQCDTPSQPRQGLLIGTETEGIFANMYLMEVDEAMAETGLPYGRYNDDIRIFGGSRDAVLGAVLVLQQQLLRRGLNLNGTKTEIAIGEPDIEALRSKWEDVSGYEVPEDADVPDAVFDSLDRPFDEFDLSFEEDDELDDRSAGDFCKYLGSSVGHESRTAARRSREPWHVIRLTVILTTWRSATKSAAWRIVEMSAFDSFSDEVRAAADDAIRRSLANPDVSRYGRLRIAMHLLKERVRSDGTTYCYAETVNDDLFDALVELASDFLADASISLNVLGLWILKLAGHTASDAAERVLEVQGGELPQHLQNAIDLYSALVNVAERDIS